MAKLAITGNSTQAALTNTDAAPGGIGNHFLGKIDRGGVNKIKRFTYTNSTGGTLADGSIINLANIGQGIITECVFSTSAMGTSRVLNIGTQEHTNGNTGATIASDINSVVAAYDVSAATTGVRASTLATSEIAIQTGLPVLGNVDLLAQVTGGTIPNGATIRGFVHVIEY